MSNVNNSQIANAVGIALGGLKKIESEAAVLKDVINKSITQLHTGKVKVGTYKKDGTGCAIATAFMDGCITAGIAASTAQKVYLPTFKEAVASGKPVSDWNGQRAKAKAGKGAKASEPKSLANKLATCWRDGGFQDFLDSLQESFQNDEIASLKEGVRSYLEAEGIELKDPADSE
jgi:hypothetical protein